MTLAVEWKVATLLRTVRPRDDFQSELLGSLTRTPVHFSAIDGSMHPSKTRWIAAAGAIAGVVSATGAAYLAHRKHHRRGAA
jgi:hypothetical protein